jgi:hypothetical protein
MNNAIRLADRVTSKSVLMTWCIISVIAIAGREINKARAVLVRNRFFFVSFGGSFGGW